MDGPLSTTPSQGLEAEAAAATTTRTARSPDCRCPAHSPSLSPDENDEPQKDLSAEQDACGGEQPVQTIEPPRIPVFVTFKVKRQMPVRGGEVSWMLSFGVLLDDDLGARAEQPARAWHQQDQRDRDSAEERAALEGDRDTVAALAIASPTLLPLPVRRPTSLSVGPSVSSSR